MARQVRVNVEPSKTSLPGTADMVTSGLGTVGRGCQVKQVGGRGSDQLELQCVLHW